MSGSESRFSWVGFYGELADKLLGYKDRRPELIAKLQDVYREIGMRMPKLDRDTVPPDIDPYTVFGLFNKGISDANRRKIVSGIAEAFDIEAEQPRDFDGVPMLNNLGATFYAFVYDSRRGERDIDNLWRVFEAELALAAEDSPWNRDAFVEAFDVTATQFGLAWKLTMGLYWARPQTFVSLDSRNRWFMGDVAKAGAAIAGVVPKEGDAPIRDGRRYLAICDAVRAELGSEECPYADFPSLSHAAFVESELVNRKRKATEKVDDKTAQENALGDEGIETVRYWLYAPGEDASMWDEFHDRGVMGLGWAELGDLNDYDSREEMRHALQDLRRGEGTSQTHSSLATWQFSHEVRPGDVVFAKRGRSQILGRGVVTGDYVYDGEYGRYPHLREVRWTHKGTWPSTQPLVLKTLTDMTDYTDFVAQTSALFEGEEEEPIEEEPATAYPAYGKEQFLSEAYIDDAVYDTLVGVLRAKKNVILQGAPGVGKTFVAKRLAYSIMGEKDPGRVQMVQFHQSYSYEDFVEGYRPSKEGFVLARGAFYTFCKQAQDDDESDYFFIIDEINRGNLSKIFGELFMLIEADKRGPRNKLQLLYSRELFHVPGNVYIIGMMNTADRSLAMLDYALRRRFAFFDLRPAFDSDGFVRYREGLGSAKLDELVACVRRLNVAIAEDDSLGEGFCIGHSYLCGMEAEGVTDARLSAIVEYELVPMLREYWFDEPSKVREWADALRRSIK